MRIIPRRLAPGRLEFGEEAPLVDHLTELRQRVVFSLIAIVVTFAVAYAFHTRILSWLVRPLPAEHRLLTTLAPTEPFVTSLMISIYAAFLLAFPVIIYQVWAFFAPALNPRIQRAVVGLTAFATLLGALGLAFGYFVALPAAVKFLTGYDSEHYTNGIRAKDYLSFASMVLIAVTVVFELPIVILGLVLVRVLSYQKLKKNRRVGYVIMAGIAVALPGIDPITTTLEMIPLMILFEGSIWMAFYLERKRRKREAAEGSDGDGDDTDTEGGSGFDSDGGGSGGSSAATADDSGSPFAPYLGEDEYVEPEPQPRADPRDRDNI